jgi:hypothetical protein
MIGMTLPSDFRDPLTEPSVSQTRLIDGPKTGQAPVDEAGGRLIELANGRFENGGFFEQGRKRERTGSGGSFGSVADK